MTTDLDKNYKWDIKKWRMEKIRWMAAFVIICHSQHPLNRNRQTWYSISWSPLYPRVSGDQWPTSQHGSTLTCKMALSHFWVIIKHKWKFKESVIIILKLLPRFTRKVSSRNVSVRIRQILHDRPPVNQMTSAKSLVCTKIRRLTTLI